jgi:hypothetical protein
MTEDIGLEIVNKDAAIFFGLIERPGEETAKASQDYLLVVLLRS